MLLLAFQKNPKCTKCGIVNSKTASSTIIGRVMFGLIVVVVFLTLFIGFLIGVAIAMNSN